MPDTDCYDNNPKKGRGTLTRLLDICINALNVLVFYLLYVLTSSTACARAQTGTHRMSTCWAVGQNKDYLQYTVYIYIYTYIYIYIYQYFHADEFSIIHSLVESLLVWYYRVSTSRLFWLEITLLIKTQSRNETENPIIPAPSLFLAARRCWGSITGWWAVVNRTVTSSSVPVVSLPFLRTIKTPGSSIALVASDIFVDFRQPKNLLASHHHLPGGKSLQCSLFDCV